MIRLPASSTSMGQQSTASVQSIRNLPHDTSERGMVQIPTRVRFHRTNERLPGAGDDRPVRHDLVRQIRAQILSGEYDSAAKVEAAAERLSGALDLLA